MGTIIQLTKTAEICFRFDGDTKEASFSVGLQGIKEEDEARVRQIISDTIDSVIE